VLVRFRDCGIGLERPKTWSASSSALPVDKSPARSSGGSGIGLTIRANPKKRIGGRIWAESPAWGRAASSASRSLRLKTLQNFTQATWPVMEGAHSLVMVQSFIQELTMNSKRKFFLLVSAVIGHFRAGRFTRFAQDRTTTAQPPFAAWGAGMGIQFISIGMTTRADVRGSRDARGIDAQTLIAEQQIGKTLAQHAEKRALI